MGILCCLKQLTDKDVDYYLKHPKKLSDLLVGNEDDDDKEDPSSTDIGKVWHAIHYLITGKPDQAEPPLDFIFYGGEDAPGAAFGFGDGHVFRSTEVKEISAALSKLNSNQLRKRFKPDKMNKLELYKRPFANEDIDWIIEQYLHLQEFVKVAADGGLGMLIYFS
jgi:hypothetical protein